MLLAVSRIGYSIEQSLADLVDNCIDARASSVLIRFVRNAKSLITIAVVDNGIGMSERELDQAMQFAAEIEHKRGDLGKYGLGMKSASFSHSRSLSVASRRKGVASGRRWTTDSIRRGWICETISRQDAAGLLDESWFGVGTARHATVVLWDSLPRFARSREPVDVLINGLLKGVALHLGLHFHRFIERGLRIYLDSFNEDSGIEGPSQEVPALNPFGYTESGKSDYPRKFELRIPNVGLLALNAHIWPPKAKSANYKLGGGKVAQRQGFYFYRNNRLIQAGGWNGWQSDAEPHLSLARVSIDLPSRLDEVFEPNVQKSLIEVPPGFSDALDLAHNGTRTLRDYVKDALIVYGRGRRATKDFPLLPVAGLTKQLAKSFRKRIAPSARRVREVGFKWRPLAKGKFFEMDRDQSVIVLNSQYRRLVLKGAASSAGDAPLLKTSLFLLLETRFDRQRTSKIDKQWLSLCNELLVRAARAQR